MQFKSTNDDQTNKDWIKLGTLATVTGLVFTLVLIVMVIEFAFNIKLPVLIGLVLATIISAASHYIRDVENKLFVIILITIILNGFLIFALTYGIPLEAMG